MRFIILAFRTLSVVASIIALLGCATHANLAIISQPEGAYLTEVGTGKSYGMAPVRVAYSRTNLEQLKDWKGCYIVRGFEARWVSGAIASVNPIQLCESNTGSYSITLSRDPSRPGLDKDLQFAVQVQMLRAQQQQANAASTAAAAAMWSVWASQHKSTVDCTTTRIGNILQTNCQ